MARAAGGADKISMKSGDHRLKTYATDACATGIPGHISETDLDGWDGFNCVIRNEAGFTELTSAVEDMLAALARPND